MAANCVPGGEDSCTNVDDNGRAVDEDGDGRANCDDSDCYTDGACRGPETAAEEGPAIQEMGEFTCQIRFHGINCWGASLW